MLPVLNLYPVLRSASAIGSIGTLRYHALKSHVARRAEQVGTDLALIIGRHEDVVRATGEQAREVGPSSAFCLQNPSAGS